jgi:thiol reductant ABC exporter CydC subunit
MKRSGLNVMARLIGLVRPMLGFMLLAIVMGLLGNLCATFITVFGGYAILYVLHPEWPMSLGWVFAAVLLFALARGFLRYAEQSCNHFIAFKLLALIRDKVFGALRRLCPAKLEGKDKGDLISVITSDIELLEVFYAHTISPICIAFLFCLMMVLFIGRIHTALGVLALSAYAVVGIVIPLVTSKRSGDDGIQFRSSAGKLSAFVLDSLRGLPETVQYGQGRKRLAEMDAQTDALSQTEAHMKRTAGKNTAAVNTTILLFDLAMLFLSAHLAGFEGCLVATLAMMSSFGPVVSLAALGATLQNTFAAGNRVLDILDESPVAPDVTGKANVEFHGAAAENVSFSYGGEQILEDLSLNIPEGKVIGITGRSGSGKSTLLKLFMRFWPVTEGKVTVSGKSVDEINTENLRDMESFVTQQTHLFHDSIRKNLCIAKLDATEEEIIAACKKASVHDFIMGLPKGYDTEVGELGDTLSGGERQRLGLARAFLHNAPFLLLDEPTSNLDSLNEAVILKALQTECQDKTVILVSHRKSTMGIADTVYSVERGRLS